MKNRTSVSTRLRALLSLLLVFGLLGALAGDVSAAEKKSKRRSKTNYIPSETTGKKLLKMSEKVEDEDYEGALEILNGLAKKRRLKKHDKALVFQNRGLMLAQLERMEEAAESFQIALDQDALPDVSMAMLRYNLAQLYMMQEEFDKAAKLLETWFETAENPRGQAYFLLTIAYFQQEKYATALPPARMCVSKDKEPTERHLNLLLAVEFQNGNLLETLEVLKTLVTWFPRKSFYMQLAYGYSNMGEEKKALAMLELAESQGFLEKNDELVSYAQRFLYHELPWKAAEVLRKGLGNGMVEPTSSNFDLYASSLLHAREYDRALEPLTKAAELSEDGDLYVRLAQVYLEVENYSNAREALNLALKKGNLRDPGNTQLLLGISNYNEKRYDDARSAFQAALQHEKVARTARQWLKHVERAIAES